MDSENGVPGSGKTSVTPVYPPFGMPRTVLTIRRDVFVHKVTKEACGNAPIYGSNLLFL